MDGTKKTVWYSDIGILTQSERPDQPPDRYAVAVLSNRDADEGSFVMRRFLSQTGKWDKLVGLQSPLSSGRRMDMDLPQEAVAFAGRLWWVDLTWGVLSADPFSERPELRFVELPSGSITEPMDDKGELGRYRRFGVSEGRLHYIEVSQVEPFMLSSFALDEDGSGWTLAHRLALRRVWWNEDLAKNKPQIVAVDPLNARVMHLTIGNRASSIDTDGKLLGWSLVGEGGGEEKAFKCLKPCVLPAWLKSSQIPSAGTLSRNKGNVKGSTLSDILVRVDRDKS